MRRIISVDNTKCTGCRLCELACSLEKAKVFGENISRIKVVSIEPKIDVALTCRFCSDPPCVRSCPRKALEQLENGTISVDENKCDGCYWCLESCAFGALSIDPQKSVVTVCDLCNGRPECVNICPSEALTIVTPEGLATRSRVSVIKKLLQ